MESDTQVLSPYSLQGIDIIESVQRRVTKRLPGLLKDPYINRPEHLRLKSLEERRIANDLIFFCLKRYTGRLIYISTNIFQLTTTILILWLIQ